jgi:hypothetical protein
VPEITRQDAIERQLNTAIWLWFHEGDVVSIHTLACAALKLAHDVGKQRGKESMLISVLNKRDKKLGKMAMIPQDFFKHARNDPNAVLNFNPGMTPYHIYDALVCYGEIYQDMSPHMKLFMIRFMLDNPEIFSGGAPALPKGFDVETVRRLNRTEFFDQFAPLVKRD